MTSIKSIDHNFWINPPWGNGKEKYRLGLKPIEKSQWFKVNISDTLINHKKNLFESRYTDVIATTKDSIESQKILAKKLKVKQRNYADLIADISLSVPDDLCIIESNDKQRLLAASICSPSYWNVKSKIGKPLKEIHKPVKSLNEKIGNPIEKFIKNAPLDKPFVRENWFIHGDDQRMHLKTEKFPKGMVKDWIVRSERETLCKFSNNHSLFAINVRFQKLSSILKYQEAIEGLKRSLENMDQEEINYFGGNRKVDKIFRFITSY
tara:strand:- start:314 stop:1108 length:795 start_codon:yes stop_codon:yes gene_type:complete